LAEVVLAMDLSCHSQWQESSYAFDIVDEGNLPSFVRIAIVMTLEMEIQKV
jgi:hypothetical protein